MWYLMPFIAVSSKAPCSGKIILELAITSYQKTVYRQYTMV
jgi:hypothetical protein